MPQSRSDQRRSAPERRRPRREDVRSDLLAAAAEEFQTRGYAATRLEAIATRAGYTKGAVYSNFGSKQELFAELLDQRITALIVDSVQGIMAADLTLDDVARRMARLSLDEERWHVLLAEFAVLATTDEEAAAVYRANRHRLLTSVTEIIRDNAARLGITGDPWTIAFLVAAVTNVAGVHGVIEPASLPLTRRAEIFSAVLRR
ncbi:TetR family transcriptional regulator [Paractinoplanes deccanensis]|uniref:TetR family transcriptional regulator n=1 Tax=Paractinoplanes deccanensis TaxID=113561 RepID=A0ABQ3XY56_9ACTN|nr:TetR/AcrR family transcriptional regulator [Actinoplanes deccanensis]GID72672.1 TetR family transcriptional regulator [Actinoplanes deccanensis]